MLSSVYLIQTIGG